MNNEIKAVFMQVVLIVVAAFLLKKMLKSAFLGSDSTAEAEAEKIIIDENASYAKEQYEGFANKLVAALGSVYGTDEDQVKGVFSKMNTERDVYNLIAAWGVRNLRLDAWGVFANDYTLTQAIADDMSESDIDEYVNQPLADNGVNYRF